MIALTNAQIRNAAEAVKSEKLRRELLDIITGAELNALDNTNHLESLTHPESAALFEESFFRTLELLVTERTVSKAAVAWFARRGITG
jgi:hypothetical protein